MQAKRNLNEKIEDIRRMFFDEWLSLRQIAKQLNVSAMAIQKVMKRNGYDTSKENLKFKTPCKLCNTDIVRLRCQIKNKELGNFCDMVCYHIYLEENSIGVINRNGQKKSRIILESLLGILPEKSVVHHIDGNDNNTEISNLMLMKSQSDHLMIHRGYGTPEILFDGRQYIQIISKTIIVNAKEKIITEDLLSYSDILKLADLPYEKSYSITFRKCIDKPEGILTFRDSIKVKNGSIFNVSITGNA